MKYLRLSLLAAPAALLLLSSAPVTPAAEEGGWGSIKGKVVWADKNLPERPKINVSQDQQHCLSKGPLFAETYVVNPKNKGVRWVMVWLVDPKNPKGKLPIHPKLQEPKDKEVVIDQPCCMFEPHVLGIREGQTLVARNSAPIPHNVNVISPGNNPNLNQLVPPGGKLPVPGWVASDKASLVKCTIHPWMQAYIRCFDHPYFAVTDEDGNFEIKDAPAGDWHLVVWQESTGWVQGGKAGVPVTVKANGVAELKFDLKPEE
jgi:hypothetical protein